MKVRSVMRFIVAGVGIVGLGVAGCEQQRNLEANAREQPNVAQSVSAPTDTAQTTPQAPARPLDVPYVPTPPAVVNEMLKIANVTGKDVLYDLGSGDGRIVITAAKKFGTRGVGIDIDPERVQEATENAQKAKVSDRVQFRQQNLFETDLSEATVVTLYLLPSVNMKLRPKLLSELKPGTRIVSHQFDMGDWKPEKVVKVRDRTVYYWVVPQKSATSQQNQ